MGKAVAVHPPGSTLAVALTPGTYPVSVHIAVGIFPTVLQQNIDLAIVATGQLLARAETGRLGTEVVGRSLILVIENQSGGSLGKGDTHLHLAVRTVGRADRLVDLAQEDTAAHQHVQIHHAQHAAILNHGLHAGTGASPLAFLGADGITGLHHPHHVGHYIRRSPGRTAHVPIGFVSLDVLGRSYGIDCLGLASQQGRLFDFAGYPMFKIGKRQRLYTLGIGTAHRQQAAQSHPQCCFLHLLHIHFHKFRWCKIKRSVDLFGQLSIFKYLSTRFEC